MFHVEQFFAYTAHTKTHIVNHTHTNSLLNNFLLVYLLPSLTHSNIAIQVNARLYLSRLQPIGRDYSDFISLAYSNIPKA